MKSVALSLALFGATVRAAPTVLYALPPSCWQPSSAYTAPLITSIKAHVSATDAQSQQSRNMVGLIQDSTDSVYVITDELVCHRAAVALSLFNGRSDTLNLSPILVIKAGRARYVLDDGNSKGGEFMASYVADRAFSIMGGMAR